MTSTCFLADSLRKKRRIMLSACRSSEKGWQKKKEFSSVRSRTLLLLDYQGYFLRSRRKYPYYLLFYLWNRRLSLYLSCLFFRCSWNLFPLLHGKIFRPFCTDERPVRFHPNILFPSDRALHF